MKGFVHPEVEIRMFTVEDVLTVSRLDPATTTAPNPIVPELPGDDFE